ncbi:MAG: hypothetical protein Q9171_002442 [Xanthocarpia ochracea]
MSEDSDSHSPFASSSSSARPTTRHFPPIEIDASPHLPGHFEPVEVCSSFDHGDPDYVIFESIKDQLNQILNDVQPDLGCAFVNYGTIGYDPDDDEYNPIFHPKVLVVEVWRRSLHRWKEIDSQIRRLIARSWLMQDRKK